MKDSILVNGAPLTRQDFLRTLPEFGIMPFCFVNGGMDYDEMEYQLRESKNKGIPGIIFHARFGILNTIGYLTKDWFDRVRFTVEKAREIGLQIWIYDEYNWPSGTAGQQLMKEHPQLTQRYLEMVEGDVPGQLFVFMEGTDSRYTDLEQSEPVYCCAILKKDLEEKRFEYVDLMPNLAFDKVITWESPRGPWRTCYFIERQASWYADVLNPETTQTFLSMVHEQYKQAMGGSLEGQLHGFYTDEPAMHYFEVARNNFIIPWSSDMFAIFKRRRGYDLKPQLPKLFYDFGGDTAQVRYDFWSCLSDQYEENYYQAIQEWCHENGTVFTGHLLCEEVIRLHARTGGNLFHMMRHFDIVGVDHLYPRVGTREMMDEHVAIKIASSAAHQFGSTRLLCESMGGSYWDCTMERMKWIGDWEYVLGVNIFNPHGFHYSIEGERKRDWPPSMFYHHTWWEQYKLFNDYLSRAGYLLTGGHHVAKVAMLYPINSTWAHYQPQYSDAVSSVIQEEFNYITDRLLRLHVDFDYIDEDVLHTCELKDGALTIRGERYECLLLPGVTHIKQKTLDMLEAFVRDGGSVIADTLLPIAFVDGGSEEVPARVKTLFGMNGQAVYDAFRRGDKLIREFSCRKEGKGQVILTPAFAQENREAQLRQAVLACVKPEIEIDNDEVFYLHRVKDGQDFFFLVNPTHQKYDLTIRLLGQWYPEEWNLLTGEITPEYVYSFQDGYTVLHKTIESVGSIMLSVTPWAGQKHLDDASFVVTSEQDGCFSGYSRMPTQVIPVSGPFDFSHPTPNALVIDQWLAYVNEDGKTHIEIESKGFDAQMIPFRMGVWELQLPTERKDKTYPADIAFKASFRAEYVPDDLRLLIDGFKCRAYSLYINGTPITETPVRSYIDAEITSVCIAPFVKRGENTIVLMMTVEERNAGLLDQLKIIGSFAVNDENALVPETGRIALGDWTKQGYPFLSAMAQYDTDMTLPDLAGKEVFLRADVGEDIFTLQVNGKDLGACLWNPYRINITRALKEGRNSLSLRVANTLQNLLRGERRKSGLYGCQLEIHDRVQEE